MTTPTQRSLKHARDLGYVTAIVERWNAHAAIRQDLFNFIDLLLMPRHESLIGVQATSGANHATRRNKSEAEPNLRLWLECGCRFEVWSWSKRGARGKRKLWTLRREAITLADLNEISQQKG